MSGPSPAAQPCQTCGTTLVKTYTCIQCNNLAFCDTCWPRWVLHVAGAVGWCVCHNPCWRYSVSFALLTATPGTESRTRKPTRPWSIACDRSWSPRAPRPSTRQSCKRTRTRPGSASAAMPRASPFSTTMVASPPSWVKPLPRTRANAIPNSSPSSARQVRGRSPARRPPGKAQNRRG